MLAMTGNVSSLAAGGSGLPSQAQAGYGASLADAGGFEQALAALQGGGSPLLQASADPARSPALQALMRPLDQIEGEAADIQTQAQALGVPGVPPPSPSEMLSLTVRCHQFMFHCQLVSTAANRSSDGLQQLLRQQA
jgi:hypothetical protein